MTAITQMFAGKTLTRDFTASIVVFLVAMPLCMGIAVASGVSPEKGLITGMIGGIVVGALAGSPLQVSGPAAGLAVIVFELVRDQGISALGPVLAVAGLIQILAGIFRLGGWFRAISPAVVHGMLAGIGVLIVAGQFHVLFDAKPLPEGLANLVAMPERIFGLKLMSLGQVEAAFGIGLATILALIGWERYRPASLKLVPGALIGVLVGTFIAIIGGLDVGRVTVPESIVAAIDQPGAAFFARLVDPTILTIAVAIAFIASAETLLSAAAVDRMHEGPRTNYNKELRAQGIGNMLCGFAGSLPMTGVIVRSSANVQAGAMTRMSTIFHGVWILVFVALLPWLLREIPMATLAGVLVVTGWRLISVSHVRHLFHQYGVLPALIWAATLATVVATDLLTGVLVGMGLSLLELVPHIHRLKLEISDRQAGDVREIALKGAATFVTLPKFNATLDAVPNGSNVRIDMRELVTIDHTCAEMFDNWMQRMRKAGGTVELLGTENRRLRLAQVAHA